MIYISIVVVMDRFSKQLVVGLRNQSFVEVDRATKNEREWYIFCNGWCLNEVIGVKI